MTKVLDHSKCASKREEGRLTKKVTKTDAGGRFAVETCDNTHSKRTRFCEWRSFWMTPMMLTYIAVFFMSVFVDDVVSFLWKK